MRFRTIGPFLVVLASGTVAAAQTKISGTIHCGKPDAQHALEAGDQPGHVFSIGKVSCDWTKPMEIAGVPTKTGGGTSFDEISGSSAKGHGQHVTTMANGDKFFVKYQGSASVKDGAPQTVEGTWSFSGGTGKLTGIKGKGMYKGKANPDGSLTYDVQGEYVLSPK